MISIGKRSSLVRPFIGILAIAFLAGCGDDGGTKTEIAPVVERASGESGDPIRNVVQANTYLVVDQLRASNVLEPLVDAGNLRVVGAYYVLDSGRVEFLPA